jgi:hypothetical protein
VIPASTAILIFSLLAIAGQEFKTEPKQNVSTETNDHPTKSSGVARVMCKTHDESLILFLLLPLASSCFYTPLHIIWIYYWIWFEPPQTFWIQVAELPFSPYNFMSCCKYTV